MKAQIPRIDTAPQGLETPTKLAGYRLAEAHGTGTGQELPLGTTPRSRRTRGGHVTIPGSKTRPYLHKPYNPGTKTQIPLVDTASQVVQTPTQLPAC